MITAPSLDESENVSGISTVVRQIINSSNLHFVHFVAGKKDTEKRRFGWFLRQFILLFRFYREAKKVDIVHINTALNTLSILRDFFLVSIAKVADKRILLHVHGGNFLAVCEFPSFLLKKIAEKMLAKADVVLVLSRREKEILESKFSGLRKVLFLENSVEVDESISIEKKPNSVIFLGRLEESKGLRELAEAMKILTSDPTLSFTLRVFGAGTLEKDFVSEMKRTLGERFYFGGVVSGEKKIHELAKSDIFVLPSRYGEGLPMAMLEAMAYECIVVVSEMASVGEVVVDGVNGFLIQPHNINLLVEKLKNILKADEEFKQSLRRNARETVKSKFNLNSYIQRLERIYREELKLESKDLAHENTRK